jgi:hypothetical protein
MYYLVALPNGFVSALGIGEIPYQGKDLTLIDDFAYDLASVEFTVYEITSYCYARIMVEGLVMHDEFGREVIHRWIIRRDGRIFDRKFKKVIGSVDGIELPESEPFDQERYDKSVKEIFEGFKRIK